MLIVTVIGREDLTSTGQERSGIGEHATLRLDWSFGPPVHPSLRVPFPFSLFSLLLTMFSSVLSPLSLLRFPFSFFGGDSACRHRHVQVHALMGESGDQPPACRLHDACPRQKRACSSRLLLFCFRLKVVGFPGWRASTEDDEEVDDG